MVTETFSGAADHVDGGLGEAKEDVEEDRPGAPQIQPMEGSWRAQHECFGSTRESSPARLKTLEGGRLPNFRRLLILLRWREAIDVPFPVANAESQAAGSCTR